jgi:hypothetical protein
MPVIAAFLTSDPVLYGFTGRQFVMRALSWRG